MGELGGFLKLHRVDPRKRPIAERVHDFKEYQLPLAEDAEGNGVPEQAEGEAGERVLPSHG